MPIEISNLVVHIGPNPEEISLINIFSLGISLIALLLSCLQWYSNRKISLKSEFIKNEAKVLIDFREKYIKAQLAFIWFRDYLLKPMRYKHPVQQPLTVSVTELQINFNLISDLNDVYNMNQHILLKYGLDKECYAIVLFLKTFEGFNFCDFSTYIYKEEKGIKEYRVDMFESIVENFTINLSDIFSNEKKEKFNIKTDYKLFEEYRDEFFNQIFALEFKLDKNTIYSDVIKKIKKRKKAFFPRYTKFVKTVERNFSESLVNESRDKIH